MKGVAKDGQTRYGDFRRAILALGLKIGSMLGTGDRHETRRQRDITRVAREHNIDSRQLRTAFVTRWRDALNERNRCEAADSFVSFSGNWRVAHLLAAVAQRFGVEDPEITNFLENPPPPPSSRRSGTASGRCRPVLAAESAPA